MPERRPRSDGRWVWVLVAVTLPLALFGIWLRFTGLLDVFCRTPDELAELMPGLRLHALPLSNLDAGVRYNFLKSMFYSQHGLGDVSFSYVASAALGALGLPVSERMLYVAGGMTNLALAAAGGLLAARFLGGMVAGWTFAVLVLVSPLYVFVSKSGWARLTWTPLLLMVLFLLQARAMRRGGVLATAAFVALAGLIALTDGFYLLPVVVVFGLLLQEGTLVGRIRDLLRNRAFQAGFVAFAAGIAVDVALGLYARHLHTNLTIMGYVFLRGSHGPLIPEPDVLAAWTQAVDWYLPFRGAWVPLTVIAVLAVVAGIRGKMIGFVAAWWLIASLAVIRYLAGLKSAGVVPPSASRLNAYHLAMPTLLLVAWFVAALADGRLPGLRRLWPTLRQCTAIAVVLATAVVLAREAYGLGWAGVAGGAAAPERLDACRTVKAAASYIRAHSDARAYVFHLSADVFLGHFGEFYYGLSYGGSVRPDEPNRLLDFGLEQFQRRYPPQAFYRAYGVPHFDYYVDFVTDRDPFRVDVVRGLESEGARVVCTIRDGDRVIGRVLSFRDGPMVDLDYRAAAQEWDRRFARPRTLIRQSLAGSAYHFGYNWRKPE